MIDLEQEFEKLMRMTIQTIKNKVASGELTRPEGNQLMTMVDVRMHPIPVPTASEELDLDEHDGWSASTLACAGVVEKESDYPPFDDDDGWTGSTRCW